MSGAALPPGRPDGGRLRSEFGQCGGNATRRHGVEITRHRTCQSTPNAAPHSRIAFSSIASNTGVRLPGEALMTCNTSAVAVCCSSASRCSVISRARSRSAAPAPRAARSAARVLDRDHRLIGKGADKFDLPVGERLDPLAREHDDPIASPSRSSGTPSEVRCLPSLIALVGIIRERRPRREHARCGPPSTVLASGEIRSIWLVPSALTQRLGIPVETQIRRQPRQLALAAEDHGLIGIAKPGGGLDHRIEHGLQIEGRAADDLQHVAGRGLVFQRLLEVGRCAGAIR